MKKIKIFFIELTNVCNMNCLFCPNDLMKRKKGFMSKGLYFKIIDEISSKKISDAISLHIMGEPLLHKNIIEFVDYAQEKKLNINLITNGILLNKYGDYLLEKKVNVDISYQTPDAKSFLLRRAGGKISFKDYNKTIFDFIEKKFKLKSKSRICVHLMNTKYKKPRSVDVCSSEKIAKKYLSDFLAKLVEIEKKYDIKKMRKNIKKDNLSYNSFYFNPKKKINLDKISLLGNSNLKKGVGDSFFMEVLPSVSILFKYASDWTSFFQNKKYKMDKALCFSALKKNFFGIFWNGDTTFCCLDYEGMLNLGNVRKKSIEEIWCSKYFNNVCKEMAKGNLIVEGCKICKGARNFCEYVARKIYYNYQIKRFLESKVQ